MSNVDLSEFKALAGRSGATCQVGGVLKQLKPAERVKLAAALAAPKEVIQHAAISRWLKQRDIKLDAQTVSRHRNGGCNCDR